MNRKQPDRFSAVSYEYENDETGEKETGWAVIDRDDGEERYYSSESKAKAAAKKMNRGCK